MMRHLIEWDVLPLPHCQSPHWCVAVWCKWKHWGDWMEWTHICYQSHMVLAYMSLSEILQLFGYMIRFYHLFIKFLILESHVWNWSFFCCLVFIVRNYNPHWSSLFNTSLSLHLNVSVSHFHPTIAVWNTKNTCDLTFYLIYCIYSNVHAVLSYWQKGLF